MVTDSSSTDACHARALPPGPLPDPWRHFRAVGPFTPTRYGDAEALKGKVAPMATIDVRDSETRSPRILVLTSDKDQRDIGRYAGWGTGDDSGAPAESERAGPAMMPFLRYRGGDRAWRLALGCLWLPTIVVVLTVEDWLQVPQGAQWISLGALYAAFIVFVLIVNWRLR
jgi:hypothetical protein